MKKMTERLRHKVADDHEEDDDEAAKGAERLRPGKPEDPGEDAAGEWLLGNAFPALQLNDAA